MFYRTDRREGYYRSDAYRGTVLSKRDPSLRQLKADVQARNKHARKYIKDYFAKYGKMPKFMGIERVQLMARGPRTKHAIHDYGMPRAYDQNLPHKYATHYDVYVRRDSYAEWLLDYQLERNLTPSQWRLIRKLEDKEMWLSVEIAKELRKHGIQKIGTKNGTRYEGIE